MKVFVVGKFNQNSGGFYYLHIFQGTKVGGRLLVKQNKLFYTEVGDTTPSYYDGMGSHEEQELDDWLYSIIQRIFNQRIIDGEWYITL